MNADDIILANRYVDGELAERDRQGFEKRIESDTRLSEYVQSLRSMFEVPLCDEDLDVPRLRFQPPSVFAPGPGLTTKRFPILATAAAVLLVLLFLGPLPFHRSQPPARSAVTFRVVYFDPGARSVAVTGDFNDWTAQFPLSRRGDSGYWVGEITTRPGEYKYVIVVDDQRWVPDPTADFLVSDDFGSSNSVVRIGL